jgi:GAF domain-containing protein/HAMP domain-containing protein
MTEDYRSPQNIETNQSTVDTDKVEDRRSRILRTIYFISGIMLIIAILNSISEFSNFGAWQILGDASFVLFALVVLIISFRFFQRGREETAVNLIPIVILLAYAPGEIFLEGVTFYNTLTGMLLFGLAWMIFRPKTPDRWIVTGIFFLVIELVFSFVHLFPRFDIYQSPSWPASLPILSSILAVLFIWQLASNIRLKTIQSRMLVSLIGLAMVPALVIGVVTALLGFQGSVDQIGNNLEAISNLKTEKINAWLIQTTSELNLLQQNSRFVSNASLLPIYSNVTYYQNDIYDALADVVENSGNFTNLYLIGPDGEVILSHDRQLNGTDLSDSELFIQGWQDIYILPPSFDPQTNQLKIQIARPLAITASEVVAVLVGELYTPNLLEIVADATNLGGTGESYLLSGDSTLLTPLRNSEDWLPGRDQINIRATSLLGESLDDSALQYQNYNSRTVIGTRSLIPELGVSMITEQEQSEVYSAINFAITLDVIISIIALTISISFAVVLARNVSLPIRKLSETASQVSSGELASIDPIEREDEIGELSRSLSEMTNQMLQTSQNLERIVAERTAVLERRSTYLEATAEIGRAITNIRNLEDLLNTVAHLISEKFGFYHVGIFIIDQAKEFAELKAANSEGGWRMLAREHKLKVGEQGIVGYVTGTGRSRIQQQVAGEDSVYYDNPDLPLTKSEMALPLKIAGEILGALDVQSVEEQAFSEEDINVLQVLADEVAVAINNTLLFQQLQESLEAERRVFGQITQEAWTSILNQQKSHQGYRADHTGVQIISEASFSDQDLMIDRATPGELDSESQTYPLSVPIKVRGGYTVAVIDTQKPASSGPWSREEITILEGVGEQLGVALENARLFEETQKSAQRERIAADLSGKIWASTDIDTILQTAVKELGSALSASEGSISLSLVEKLGETDTSIDRAGEA